MLFATGLEGGEGRAAVCLMTLKVFPGTKAFVCFSQRRHDRIDRGESKQSLRIKLLKVSEEKGRD